MSMVLGIFVLGLLWSISAEISAASQVGKMTPSFASTLQYPIRQRTLHSTTQQFSIEQYRDGTFPVLTYTDESPPKILRPFLLELFSTDGSLPENPSLKIIATALETFVTAELNRVFAPYDRVVSVSTTFVRQNTVVQSSLHNSDNRRREKRFLRQTRSEIGTQLETELLVTFRNEPSPPSTDVDIATEYVMRNLESFVRNITALADGNRELAEIGSASRKSMPLGDNGPEEDDHTDNNPQSIVEEPTSDSGTDNSLGLDYKILAPIVVAGCLLLVTAALFTYKRLHGDRNGAKLARQTDLYKNQYQDHEVKVFMDEDSDIFSFEAALVESPAVRNSSHNTSGASASSPHSRMYATDEQSDIFSGLESEITSPKSDGRSVLSFLTGFLSSGQAGDASTVVASNTTTARQRSVSPAVAAVIGASAGMQANRMSGNNTPASLMSSLFTFSEENEEDILKENEDDEKTHFDADEAISPASGNRPYDEVMASHASKAMAAASVAAAKNTRTGKGLPSPTKRRSPVSRGLNVKISSESSGLGSSPRTPGGSTDLGSPFSTNTGMSHMISSDDEASFNASRSKSGRGGLSKLILVGVGSPISADKTKNDSSGSPSPNCQHNYPKESSQRTSANDSQEKNASFTDLRDRGSNRKPPLIPLSPSMGAIGNAFATFARSTTDFFRGKDYASDSDSKEAKIFGVKTDDEGYGSDPGPLTPRTKSHMIQLQWDNPKEAYKNKSRAAEFVATVGSPDSSVTGSTRRHAKTTAEDGAADYQNSTMKVLDTTANPYQEGNSYSDSDVSQYGMVTDGETRSPIPGQNTSPSKKRKIIRAPSTSPTKKASSPNSPYSETKTPPRPAPTRAVGEFATPKSAMSLSKSHLSSPDSNASSEIDASKMLLNDLVWLENKIATGKKLNQLSPTSSERHKQRQSLIDQVDSLSFASNDGAVSTSESDTEKSPQNIVSTAQMRAAPPGMSSIVCRDCFAPPGKLKIIIHSTKDGPAVHTVKKGSSLEGHIFPGDLIISVDNMDTRSHTAEQVMKLMTAKTAHERKITVLHFETTPLLVNTLQIVETNTE